MLVNLFTGEKVDNWIGVTEMMLGAGVLGCLFSLFSGQPLIIVGSTGPLIIFEETLFTVSRRLHVLSSVLLTHGSPHISQILL